jgi:hypothetical protein
MARDATAVAGCSVVIAGKAPLKKPLGSSARLLFPPETYQQIGIELFVRRISGIRPSADDFDVPSASEFNDFQSNSLRNGTGNFWTRIRENFSRNRHANH